MICVIHSFQDLHNVRDRKARHDVYSQPTPCVASRNFCRPHLDDSVLVDEAGPKIDEDICERNILLRLVELCVRLAGRLQRTDNEVQVKEQLDAPLG